MSDALPDHSISESLGSGFLHVTGIGSRLARRAAAEERLDALDAALLNDLDREFHERGVEGVPGLDLASVTRVDPEFTPDAFLLIARDSFRVLQDAHTAGAPALDADIAAQTVEQAVRDGAGELLEDVRLFDVYTGPQLGESRKSLTFALRFRAPDRTLTEDDASAARDAAVRRAATAVGAVLRA